MSNKQNGLIDPQHEMARLQAMLDEPTPSERIARAHATAHLMSSLATALSALIAAVPGMDLEPVAARKWQHTLSDVAEMLDDLRCARCEDQPIAALRGVEFVCRACDALFVDGDCQGCGRPLLISEACGEFSDRHAECEGPR